MSDPTILTFPLRKVQNLFFHFKNIFFVKDAVNFSGFHLEPAKTPK